jgi:hypothetical protein
MIWSRQFFEPEFKVFAFLRKIIHKIGEDWREKWITLRNGFQGNNIANCVSKYNLKYLT